jgi:hypothetical protein
VRSPWWIDVHFMAGTGVPSSAPALGGDLRIARVLGGPLFVDGTLAGSASTYAAYRLLVFRPSISAGVGAILRVSDRFRFTLDTQGSLQLIEVQGTDSSGSTDASGRWVTGVRQSVDVEWAASDTLGLTVGAMATEASGSTEIQARGRAIVRLSPVDLACEAGLRIAIP